MIDYETLRIIWWALLGILLIGFAIMDGFDLGTAMLIPFVGKSDIERRVVINTIGPVWEGNQVWFILGGGAIFAAWPILYAVSFSGFYFAMFVVLCTFIIRPVGFKYRSKMPSPIWRTTWDWLLASAGFVAALIFGVAVGNVLQGVPFHFDAHLRSFYTGSFWQLLNPFAIVCGLLSVCMIIMQGGFYVATKTEQPLHKRAINIARVMSLLVILIFAGAGFWVMHMESYTLLKSLGPEGPSNPLNKLVGLVTGSWLNNYAIYPLAIIAPLMGFTGALFAPVFATLARAKISLVMSSLSIFGIISTVGVSMYPFLLPSSSNPNMSLLVWDASSSHFTLGLMLGATLVFLPIVIAYTTWVYRVLRGPITVKSIENEDKTLY